MAISPTLRLTQTGSADNRHTITLEWLNAGPRQTANATVELEVSERDQQDIRWYLEEYAEYPFEPNPEIAARVEERMHELGKELFRRLFAESRTLRLWADVSKHLDDTRIEIETDAAGATALPWELLRDPDTDEALALHARAFVRSASKTPRQALRLEQAPVIRILLVICRPGGREDVPFRSVASRIVKGLSSEAREVFRLDVLRPPTFDRRGQVLRDAKARGEPYHVVHFDGHGAYGTLAQFKQAEFVSTKFKADMPQGFLLFESDKPDDQRRFIDGGALGKLLVQNDVALLVLNACRSAHAEHPSGAATDAATEAQPPVGETDDPYEKVRAFGSLAQQVMLAGVGGVVAMRYNVYVVTAAQFVAELYRALLQGRPLGEAVSQGRKHLHEQPVREIVERLSLEDWLVPVVYEAEAMQVFQPTLAAHNLQIAIRQTDATPRRGTVDEKLPAEPDAGFFGRDETLLALDRGFDRHHVVLLHAYAGSGKTTTAAEFARWYALTGGVEGPVLYSSFEQRLPLSQLLDQFGLLFNERLRQSGVDWQTLTETDQKRNLALQILRQIPVLWVWDNVEPVAGFPGGTLSAWTAEEQRELADFLRAARGSKAKFLLTSRRNEQGWLGGLPHRVTLPPMPMAERRQLAEALAASYGVMLDHAAWQPLLFYSGGNPMTLTVVAGQALRDGLRTAGQIREYVLKLRAGETVFDDDVREGRSRSLGASLDYGFAASFTEQEQMILALLYHFQGFVNVNVLRFMGDTNQPWHVPAVAGLTRETGISLLNRATEVGLLSARGDGYYSIHPALPWFFRQLYVRYYSEIINSGEDTINTNRRSLAFDASRAYVEAISGLGRFYHEQYETGHRDVIVALQAEYANLIYARKLALRNGWYNCVVGAMQGLITLYGYTGRWSEWRILVNEVEPYFINPINSGSQSGREDGWAIITYYRVELLKMDRRWAAAAQLQKLLVDFHRQKISPLLTTSSEQLDSSQRNIVRSLAVSVELLGSIQREQGLQECTTSYLEAYKLALQINDNTEAANCAFNLGRVYAGDIPPIQNLAQAEEWYQKGLTLSPQHDVLIRGRMQGQLGYLALRRFQAALRARESHTILSSYLSTAREAFEKALNTFPPGAVDDMAIAYGALGGVYLEAGQIDESIAQYREAVRCYEQLGNLYDAALVRENIAVAYARSGRLNEALLFARAALHTFDQFGTTAAQAAAKVRQNIAWIESLATRR